MNKIKTILLTAIITTLLIAVGVLISRQLPKPSFGSAPQGATAVSGSSSLITLPSHSILQIFASSTCVSRMISLTPTSSIQIGFVDSETFPSAGEGSLQAASTTVVYDSGTFGCETWRAYNPGQNSITFTITEFLGFR